MVRVSGFLLAGQKIDGLYWLGKFPAYVGSLLLEAEEKPRIVLQLWEFLSLPAVLSVSKIWGKDNRRSGGLPCFQIDAGIPVGYTLALSGNADIAFEWTWLTGNDPKSGQARENNRFGQLTYHLVVKRVLPQQLDKIRKFLYFFRGSKQWIISTLWFPLKRNHEAMGLENVCGFKRPKSKSSRKWAKTWAATFK